MTLEVMGRINTMIYENNMGTDELHIKIVVSSKDQPLYENLHCGSVKLVQKDLDDEVRGL
jgi:hypothetical protein